MHPLLPQNMTDRSLLDRAVEALGSGQLVAFPTETVYGLGADAGSAEALARLYKVKQRPEKHPVIVHIGDSDQLADWAEAVPESAYKLASVFWPGPLTMVLKRSAQVLDQVTGGQDTVALRVPRHPVALGLLRAFGRGIAAPSANRFGHLSPTTAEAVASEIGSQVAIVLDGGPCQVGIESTIVNLSGAVPEILRPGMILGQEIEAVLACAVRAKDTTVSDSAADSPLRAPGGLPRHYAPETPMQVVPASELEKLMERLDAEGMRLAVISFAARPERWAKTVWLSAPGNSIDYAHDLYGNLRYLDRQLCHLILVESPPEEAEWAPIRDRLVRAAHTATG